MTKSYEIRSGRRVVTETSASTAQEALVDYLRSLGCRDEDLVRVSADAVSWRGAVYTAAESSPTALERHAA